MDSPSFRHLVHDIKLSFESNKLNWCEHQGKGQLTKSGSRIGIEERVCLRTDRQRFYSHVQENTVLFLYYKLYSYQWPKLPFLKYTLKSRKSNGVWKGKPP